MTRDVTNAVQRIRNTYGGSDNTNSRNVAANKSINYASGNTVANANQRRVTVAPSSLTLTGEVGLFGVENAFVKVDLNILDMAVNEDADIDGYFPFLVLPQAETSPYTGLALNDTLDLINTNDYAPAKLVSPVAKYYEPVISIDLENTGTGNTFIDSHVDVRLYSEDRVPIASDQAFVSPNGCFFVGIHARKTRRLAYNVNLTLGQRYVSLLDLTARERDLVLTRLGASY